MKYACLLLMTVTVLLSCNQTDTDHDADGALLADKLENISGGGFNITPMQQDDSASRAAFTPDKYHYKGKPYTGKITAYDDKQRKIMDGALTDGVANGAWKFYYASGVVQISGNYSNGLETGTWTSFYTVDKPRIVKVYDTKGNLLMRAEYFDNGRIKNYQNIACPEYGNIARRIQFKYSGEIDYIDAEREIGKLTPADLNALLTKDGLRQQ